jgi:hypothetical protein
MPNAPENEHEGTAMTTIQQPHLPDARRFASVKWPLKTALLMVALVGGFYLLQEHWNHVAGGWAYLLLLACPLMHFFHGHGGHAGHGRHGDQAGHGHRAEVPDARKE